MNSTDTTQGLPTGSPLQEGEIVFCIGVSRSGKDDVKVSGESYMAPGWVPKPMLKSMLKSMLQGLETQQTPSLN